MATGGQVQYTFQVHDARRNQAPLYAVASGELDPAAIGGKSKRIRAQSKDSFLVEVCTKQKSEMITSITELNMKPVAITAHNDNKYKG